MTESKSIKQNLFRITLETIRHHNPYKMSIEDAGSFFDLYQRDFHAVLSNAFAEFVRGKMAPHLQQYVSTPSGLAAAMGMGMEKKTDEIVDGDVPMDGPRLRFP